HASAETLLADLSAPAAAGDASAEAREHECSASALHRPRSERYLVLLHVDEATLTPGREPGRSDLEDGTRVPAETARLIACDAGIVRVVHGRNGREIRVEGK